MKIKERTTPRRQQFPIGKSHSINLTRSNVSFSIRDFISTKFKKPKRNDMAEKSV